ncbi:MAG: hypothetical protein KBC16_03615 [Candidatus Pacebacteria bacterium]|nr:hypothetical protein [Candidatus Paceibacterota bacterium]
MNKKIPKPYFKKIDRSFFKYGLIIPIEYEKDFLFGVPIHAGESRETHVKIFGKKYPVKLYHVNRNGSKNVYQLRWDMNRDLCELLRDTFINSYVILQSQKEKHEALGEGRKKFRTKLLAGQQEVLSLRPLSATEILAEPFIQIETEWSTLFRRLAAANVFESLFVKDREHLVEKTTSWLKVQNFAQHKEQVSVIYYLANTKDKSLYIGKANKLGDRVVPGRGHQGMAGDWDKFKYDIIKPEFGHLLERIEDHTIRSVASILKNSKDFPTLGVGSYTLVNRNWKRP